MGKLSDGYGCLKGILVDYQEQRYDPDGTPHFVLGIEACDRHFRVAINLYSGAKELPKSLRVVKCLIDPTFEGPLLANITPMPQGLTELDRHPRRKDMSLDYVRSQQFNVEQFKPLPYDRPGRNNDLNDKLIYLAQRALRSSAAVYVFGEVFPAKDGLHNVHMNQGTPKLPKHPTWWQENGIYQDGGVLIDFGDRQAWTGAFFAFASQSWTTNNDGQPIDAKRKEQKPQG